MWFLKKKNEINEKTFYDILENIPVSVVITDPNQKDNPIIFCNHAFTVITEYSKEETIGKNCRFLQGINTEPEKIEEIRVAIRKEKPLNSVLTNYTKSGKPFTNELIIVPIFHETKLKYFVAIQNDLARPTYIK